ncbi:hypothetical protein MHU86_21084 [Fragilaria crotonensis]|nr:hypothetical protein MHU86_21084 [Fragilaria crotonensis]
MALTKHKRDLLAQKASVGAEFLAIEKEDVIHLVHRAWNDSFARIKQNQNAIAERGWTPLTYNCLLHPEILQTRTNKAIGTTATEEAGSVNAPNGDVISALDQDVQLNLSQGLSGKYMDTILESRIREDARNGVNLEENRQKRIDSAEENINSKKKRYTAGLHASGCWTVALAWARRS